MFGSVWNVLFSSYKSIHGFSSERSCTYTDLLLGSRISIMMYGHIYTQVFFLKGMYIWGSVL